MKIFYDTNSVEENGIRTLYGGGTNATTASGALFNLGGVSLTESQTISGAKEFAQRPTVNGTGVLLEGEIQSNTIISGVVYSAQVNVKNGEGNTIYKGQPVYIKGANGSNIIVGLASNSGEQTSSKTLGLVVQNSLANNAFGTVITDGLLEGFNASAANAGDPIWLGPSGSLIYGLANKPHAPNHLVYLGVVTRAQNNGELFVKVQNGYELEELHNVGVTGAVSGQFLYKQNGQWSAKNIGISDVSNLQSSKILGRTTAGTGLVEELGVAGNLVLSGGILTSKTTDIQIFATTGSTTWTKPLNAKSVNIQLFGAGGGGGSGRKDSAGATSKSGGAGGGGGGYLNITLPASVLENSETVTIGAGGAGAAGRTTNNTNGITASSGGNTTFNSLVCQGGNGGGGGSVTTATTASAALNSNAGGSVSITANAGSGSPTLATVSTQFGGAGGGAGGSVAYVTPTTTAASGSTSLTVSSNTGIAINSIVSGTGIVAGTLVTNVSGTTITINNATTAALSGTTTGYTTAFNGGGGGRSNVLNFAGGSAGGANTGLPGGAGTNNTFASTGLFAVGSGGGGGGAGFTFSGGDGGNGGFPAGGGGGGGATETGTTSGAGGAGADGMAIITTYF